MVTMKEALGFDLACQGPTPDTDLLLRKVSNGLQDRFRIDTKQRLFAYKPLRYSRRSSTSLAGIS